MINYENWSNNTSRYDSTRFPGKVLMNLPFNENSTVLGHIVKRLKKLELLYDIIIATSKIK